jgi:hypothetical protein
MKILIIKYFIFQQFNSLLLNFFISLCVIVLSQLLIEVLVYWEELINIKLFNIRL